MKTSNGMPAVLLVGMLGLVGCEGADTVTGVDSGTGGTRFAQSASKVVDTSASLSGLWNGTIEFLAFNDLEGDTAPSPCSGKEIVRVALNQNGDSVSGRFESGCAGTLRIQGVIVGSQISGTLASSSGPGFGRIFGTASASRIQFRTVELTDDEDDNGRDNDGDASFTSTNVVLDRSIRSDREAPLRAGSDRGTRMLAPRR